jgi:signal transduction histidine kinase/ligand-binding sensor domain-containing protein
MRRHSLIALILAALALPMEASAERLPVRRYTTSDGLFGDSVRRIFRDSRGFLWFCGTGGVSRFDGERFTNYTPQEGLPFISANDILETRRGEYWVATNGGGIARLEPRRLIGQDGVPLPRFAGVRVGDTARTNRVNLLYEDRAGTLWIGTDDGLFRLDSSDRRGPTARRVELPVPAVPGVQFQVWTFLEDPDGSLWIGTSRGLFRRSPAGGVERHEIAPAGGTDHVWTLLRDRHGRVWMGHQSGLVALGAADAPLTRARHYPVVHAGRRREVRALRELDDGQLLVGGNEGVLRFDGTRVEPFGSADGLAERGVSFEEDRDGNLWIATGLAGVVRVARHGFVTYDRNDGLEAPVMFVGETAAGLYTVGSRHVFSSFDGTRFHAVLPPLPADVFAGRDTWHSGIQDRAGEWWIPTQDGLFRLDGAPNAADLARARVLARYTVRDGLPSNNVKDVFEDSRGDLWIATRFGNANLARFDGARNAISTFAEADGMPVPNEPVGFAEDRRGSVWISLRDRGLARFQGGRFRHFTTADGLPAGGIGGPYVDDAGTVWIGSAAGGVLSIQAPETDAPRFIPHPTAGLASKAVSMIAGDSSKRLYLGTPSGVDRLDVASGRVRHFSSAEGLASSTIYKTHRDRRGNLWFATASGLSMLVPEAGRPGSPPPVFIEGIHIAGEAHPLSELGESRVSGLQLASDRNRVQIDFGGLTFGAGRTLRYRYQLAGLDRSWSAPTAQRSITYAHLAPGSYTFLLRAIDSDGMESVDPASVSFVVLRPVWQRWWFVALVGLGVGLLVHSGYHLRERRLLELERVRTRIASDLHDDIGAGLSRMSILAEVARRQLQTPDTRATAILSDLADSARDLVSSMSDVVWSVDPRRDDLASVILRLREFASSLLDAKGIEWRLDAPADAERIKLTPEQRRDLFLVIKEALTNVVRHAECRTVRLRVQADRAGLLAEVSDDGYGFEHVQTGATPYPKQQGGYGLRSMRARATRAGGQLTVISAPGHGTCVQLTIPFRRRIA